MCYVYICLRKNKPDGLHGKQIGEGLIRGDRVITKTDLLTGGLSERGVNTAGFK